MTLVTLALTQQRGEPGASQAASSQEVGQATVQTGQQNNNNNNNINNNNNNLFGQATVQTGQSAPSNIFFNFLTIYGN